MNNMNSLLKAKKSYMETAIPDGVDKSINDGIKKGEKILRRRYFKPLIAVAACIMIFTATINISPAFASFLGNTPVIGSVVELLNFDKNLSIASKKGFKFNVNSSSEDKDIKFTINSVIMDSRRMIIDYSLETTGDYKGLYVQTSRITDKNGNSLLDKVGFNIPFDGDDNDFIKNKKKDGIFEIEFSNGSELPDKIVITICELTEGWRFNNPRVIEGNWSVGFNIKNKIPETKPIVYSLNKSYEYKEIKFTVDEIRIYPTVTEVVYHQDIPNQIDFNSVYLKDNAGRKYKLIKSHYENDRIILSFQSSYFIKASSLSLIIEGMTVFYPYDGENNYMTFDIDNKKIINSKGLNLEYIRDEKINDSINPPSLLIYFNPNMPKGDNLLYMTAEVYDESNNKYQGGTISSEKEDGNLETGLAVYNIKTRPHFIKVKLYGYNRKYDKSLIIKIK